MITITVEFTGVARQIAGAKQTGLNVQDGITYREVIQILGKKYPGLIGILIAADGASFLSSNMFSVNGEKMILPGMEDQSPQDGDRLILISVITGG